MTKVPSPSRSEWTAHSASPEKRLSHNIAFVQQAAFGRIFSRSSRRCLNLPVFGSSSAFLPINRFGGHAVSSGSWIFDLTTQTRCVPLCISSIVKGPLKATDVARSKDTSKALEAVISTWLLKRIRLRPQKQNLPVPNCQFCDL